MSRDTSGPVMLAATSVLRGHKTRIGKITKTYSLPRTIPLVNLIAGGTGGFLGLLAAVMIHATLQTMLYGLIIGGGAGVFMVTYSPLQGESMLKWIGISLAAKRQEVKIDGQSVRVAIGVAYISEPARGPVRILGGAIDVDPEQFDERGVLISARNKNLPASQQMSSRDLGDSRAVTSTPLPANTAQKLGRKPSRPARGGNSETVSRPAAEPARRSRRSRVAAAQVARDDAAAPWRGEEVAHPQPVAAPWEGEGIVEQSVDPFGQEQSTPRRRRARQEPTSVEADPFASKPRKLPKN